MSNKSNYRQYAEQIIAGYPESNQPDLLIDAVKDLEIKRVLDVGCGAGQEMIPFAERRGVFCVGIDVGAELGEVGNGFVGELGQADRVNFARSQGSDLPFASASFDVVLCRVALPYMNNKKAIAEVARVLRPGGVYLLKTHAPAFYIGMLKRRLGTFQIRQYAYPLICLAGGLWHQFTGRQLEHGLWSGKETYQTGGFLKRELAKHGLEITGTLPDTNIQTPSFYIVKR